MQNRLVLASQSPRRQELLRILDVPFEVIPSGLDESATPANLTPAWLALWLAEQKAQEVAQRYPGAFVIGADTIVVLGDEVMGKPADHERAVQLLGQIDAAGSSRGLAYLAVHDTSAEVRRAATETLKRRDPREFAGLLVALLRDPIKYEVRPVGGPGDLGHSLPCGKGWALSRAYLASRVRRVAADHGQQDRRAPAVKSSCRYRHSQLVCRAGERGTAGERQARQSGATEEGAP